MVGRDEIDKYMWAQNAIEGLDRPKPSPIDTLLADAYAGVQDYTEKRNKEQSFNVGKNIESMIGNVEDVWNNGDLDESLARLNARFEKPYENGQLNADSMTMYEAAIERIITQKNINTKFGLEMDKYNSFQKKFGDYFKNLPENNLAGQKDINAEQKQQLKDMVYDYSQYYQNLQKNYGQRLNSDGMKGFNEDVMVLNEYTEHIITSISDDILTTSEKELLINGMVAGDFDALQGYRENQKQLSKEL